MAVRSPSVLGVLITTCALVAGCTSSPSTPLSTTPDAGDPNAVVRVVVTPPQLSLPRNTSQRLTATAFHANGNAEDVTSAATWSSTDAKVVAVSNAAGTQGQLTALAAGSANVSAVYAGASASTAITVTEGQPIALIVFPSAASVPAGRTQAFNATALYPDYSMLDVSSQVVWSSSDPNVASAAMAPAPAGTFATHVQGSATVTATLGALSGNQLLTVTAPALDRIELEAARTRLAAGMSQRVDARGYYSDGSNQLVTGQTAWSSSDPMALAVPSANGPDEYVQALTPGTAYVLGAIGPLEAILRLSVVAVPNTFAAPVFYDTSGGGGGVGSDLLDVDGDGRQDVLGLVFGSLRYYRNQGDGTLGPAYVIPTSRSYSFRGSATGDVNGDHHDDIVVSAQDQNDNSEHVLVLEGAGNGTFTLAHSFDPGAPGPDVTVADVTIADVDGDGFQDIVAGTSYGNVIDIYWGDAGDAFSARTELSLTNPESIAVADFDGDHVPDLAVVSNEAAVVILHNNGDRTFKQVSSRAVSTNFAPQIRAADLNVDGKMDVVVPGSGMSVLLGQGDGTLAAPNHYGASGNTMSIRLADVNLDGKTDVVGNNDQLGALVWYGHGDGTFQSALAVSSHGGLPQSAEATDLNGDQLPDLIVMNNSGTNAQGLSVMLQTY